MKGKVLFISGIDTNVGKTYATGILARQLAAEGHTVITQKMIQTGCTDISEDIEMHRQLMGIPFTEEDKAGLTCPYIFTYPCSPHMAAERDGRRIDLSVITRATQELQKHYEYVLLEGAGGINGPQRLPFISYRLHPRAKLSAHPCHLRQVGKHQPHPAKPLCLPSARYSGRQCYLQPISAYRPAD